MDISRIKFYLLLTSSLLSLSRSQEQGKCKQPVDLVFALDTSGSVKADGFGLIKSFTKAIVEDFDIGVADTHVGVISFSEYAEAQIRLTETFDKTELFQMIDSLNYPGYRTATDDALRVANTDFFTINGGGRQNVPQVLILLNDGKCTICTEPVKDAAQRLKDRGIEIFTIGVTDSIEEQEMKDIASHPVSKHFFKVDQFEDLKNIVNDLQTRACEVKKGKCPKPQPPFRCPGVTEDECGSDEECRGEQKCCFDGCSRKCRYPLFNCITPIDVAFALDSSSSVSREAYSQMKQFSEDIVDSFATSQTETRFAALVYSNVAELSFGFVRFDDAESTKNAIRQLPKLDSRERIDYALELAKSDIFSLQGKVRTRRPMVLLVFYDGTVVSGMRDLEEVAEPLKEYGVRVIALGVGPEVIGFQMNKIVSDTRDIFQASDMERLVPEIYNIAKQACSEKPGQCEANALPPEVCKEVVAVNECENDFECFGNAKCCKKGCSNVCVKPSAVCPRKLDIAFAVHQNMDESEFAVTKYFLKSAIDRFDVKPDKAHIAVMTFGREAKLAFDFNNGQESNENVRQKVDNLEYEYGIGRLTDILALSCDAVFCATGGTRDNMPKMLVIITGRSSPSPASLLQEKLQILRNRGINILVIGVGNVDTSLLQAITSDDPAVEDRVLLLKRFDGILQYSQDIVDVACGQAAVIPEPGEIKGEKGTCGGGPKTCYKGPKGSRGRPGKLGQMGEPGERGLPGPKGIQGPKGTKGPDGRMGPKGERGPDGLIGLPGFPGYNGVPGVPGIEGRRGRDGDCGLPGSSGEAGIPGVDGFSGPPGRQGAPGQKGFKGLPAPENPDILIEPGDRGEPGEIGETGYKGIKGDDGYKGMIGDDGLAGEDGPPGEPGEMGDVGTSNYQKGIKGDRGDPGPAGPGGDKDGTKPSRLGSPGDAGQKGELGPPGDPGPQGEASTIAGRQGRRGSQGPQGELGFIGPAGPRGQKGPTGDDGSKGKKGDQGENGRDGLRGRQGQLGTEGEKGSTGKKGQKGGKAEGIIGENGRNGQKGENGTSGSPGPIGLPGPPGEKGKPGNVQIGRAGDPGSVGPRGSRGDNGLAGEPGMIGVTGPKGPKGNPGPKGTSGRIAELVPGKDGMMGPPGVAGVQGPVGDPGPPGPPGPPSKIECIEGRCPKGTPGRMGPSGDTGELGNQGPQGPNGTKGVDGGPCPVCPEGIQGNSGEVGQPGMPGKHGEKGSRGERGEAGQKGLPGEKGLTGPEGPKGDKGVSGDVGAVGEDGIPALGLQIAPRGPKGSPGNNGTQGTRGNPGPKGRKGRKGQAGEMGKRGLQGQKGVAGSSGLPGNNGLPGRKGFAGEPGEGIRGSQGDKGNRGQEGLQGVVGALGPPGPKGQPGSEPTEEEMRAMKEKMSGDEGSSGPRGDIGDFGPMGPKGPSGPRGPKGFSGPVGPKGPGGLPGDQGPPGRAGEDGDPGFLGFPGLPGKRGPPGESGAPGPRGVTERGDPGERGEPGVPGKKGIDAPPPPDCFTFSDPTDIGFILDSSRSVTDDNFFKQKEFVKNIIKQFPVGPDQTQVGIIKYGEKADTGINFYDFFTEPDLFNAIDSLDHSKDSASRLDLALKMARDELFTASRGARGDEVNKALVILGDGFISGGGIRSLTLMKNAQEYARDLRNAGVSIFALAVGPEKNDLLLRDFVSNPEYYLEIESYAQLDNKLGALELSLRSGCVTVGDPGRDGRPGEPGQRGSKGNKGQPGFSAKGFDGSPGRKGERGEPGLGYNGIPGDPGFMGFPGEKGKSGTNGRDDSGEKGQPGQKGERGDAIQGPPGDLGEIGPIGPRGFDSSRLCDSVLAVDILFVLDTSSGVGQENFNKMLQFVKEIIKVFDVNNQLTRVSVITYDSDARLVIRFTDYNNIDRLNTAIDAIQYVNGRQTRIDKALLLAGSAAYLSSNGGRDGYNKALVLMTDGQQSFANDQTTLALAVKPLEDASVLRYAVGIGNEISPFELEAIAGPRVITADNYDELQAKIEDQISLLGRVGCRGATGANGKKGENGDIGFPGLFGEQGERGRRGEKGKPGFKGKKGETGEQTSSQLQGEKGDRGDPGPIGLPACVGGEENNVITDLGFAIDASGSLYQEGFQNEKEFVKNVVDKVGPVSESGLRVGVIVYSNNATIEIKFDDHFDNSDLKRAIDRLPFYSRNTRMDLGLIKAKELFAEENGGRGSSKKVLILLADGQQSYVPGVTEPSEVAKELAADGVDIFAIGIGQEIDRTELESLISKKQHIFLASDVSSLITQLSNEITTALKCEGGPRGPQGRPGGDGPPGSKGQVGPPGGRGYKGDPGIPGFGPQGDKGDKGPLGRAGDKGGKGFRGSGGLPGPRGSLGPKGFDGSIGEKGGAGDRGFIGFPGPDGAPGPKGERGSSSASGAKGERGDTGATGYIGPRGDPGKLPPGNRIEDFKGDQGSPGGKGNVGPAGKKGRLTFEIGPIGLPGTKGEKGSPGLFGVRAGKGNKGLPGFQGFTGDQGPPGPVGEDGFTGLTGLKGFTGEIGSDGNRGRKGEPGESGVKGQKGPPGERGEQGFPGFIGMPGKKGGRGEPGPKGRQQFRNIVDPARPGPKGYPGPTGIVGDQGPEGDIGEPGEVFGAQGSEGDKGELGPRGPRGQPGERGLDGMAGFVGNEGPKGRAGSGGDPGAQGSRGPRGDPGEVITSSEKGAKGQTGIIGLSGRTGAKGIKGLEGPTGRKGRIGETGNRGPPGFPGLIGEPGPPGSEGPKGPDGEIGQEGEPGLKGEAGQKGIAEGFYIVRHSQDAFIPRCPRNYKQLWTGYSLMYTVGNGHAYSQDLGNAGSCSRSFSTLPFLFCGLTDNCKYASRNDFVYWLSGDVRQPMMPVSNSAVEPFISRCVVCEAPSIHIAVHSQDVFNPECPRGWDSLWHGYSFLMIAGAGKTGAGQSLSSSGSCLESFKPKPFIECQGARGTCHFFSDKYSFWLTTIDQSKQFETQQPQTLSKDKGDDLTSRVSRCRVCIRGTGGGNIVEPGIIKRIKRSISSWFNRNQN